MTERRISTRKVSIVIGNDRVYTTDRRPSHAASRRSSTVSAVRKASTVSAVRKASTVSGIRKISASSADSKSSDGFINVSFLPDETPLQEVNVGQAPDVRRKSISYIKQELEIDYHVVDVPTLCNRFSTNASSGLDSGQVDRNAEKFGRNFLTPPKQEPLWLKFIKTLVGGFQLLLWTAAVLSFIAYLVQKIQLGDPPPDNLYLGIALVVLVLVLGLFTFYQEFSSGKVMESFAKMVPSYASVTRDGKLQNVNATELVVGDIVDVKFGDRIPADIRILECQGFKVDNSSLTGESDPQTRSAMCTDENPMETRNLAFFSSNALEGTARGLVVAVGDNTFIGRIAGLATGLDHVDTPMAREVSYFVKIISGVAVFFGVTFFIISLILGYHLIDAAIFLVGIIVANVPEGLLVTFTVILALTANRMAHKNCVVRQLHAVETLGSCSVICSDKTGTLTQNKMTVSHMWFGNGIVDASPTAGIFEPRDVGFAKFSRVAALCSRAKFLPDQEALEIRDRIVNGDASESAILRCMEMQLGDVERYQAVRQKIFEIPFNSSNKWQLSVHDLKDSGDPRYLLVMKGAPERIINLCTKIRIGEVEHPLDDTWKKTLNNVYEELGGLGERVIGFCDLMLPEDKYPKGHVFDSDNTDFIKEGLTFVGLISMIDPPRPGVLEAVETCRVAGIKVVMVTGDHPITAKAIARKVGIISEGNYTREEKAKLMNITTDDVNPRSCQVAVVSGTELLELSSQELDDLLKDHTEIVFARVSPQQKLVIVEGFQRLGKIVAVTGDGVNDSPALKRADIGIAMGIAGSDVSKQAADMILLDDNFSSIVTGVEEGRLIFENLKKCIRYLLCANTANLLPFLVYITFQIPLPLGTIPMLVITLGTDILPTISLSYEKAEGDIIKRQPRNPVSEKLVTQQLMTYAYGILGVIEFFAGFFTYIVIMGQNGFLPRHLIGIRSRWDSITVNDLEDSYGQQWTFYQRKGLERTCWSGYFCTVVICQWGNLLISKVRREALHTKFFDNWIIFVAILGETLLACFCTYTPGLNQAISYMPIKILWWFPSIPFCLLLVFSDEVRRFVLRNRPKWHWYQQEFYY